MYEFIFLGLSIVLYSLGQIALSVWVMAILALKISLQYGNVQLYLEIIEDYPVEHCIKPQKCKFLFKNLKSLSYKDIPKELYFSELVKYMGLWIYTFVGMIVLFFDERTSVLIGILYFLCVYGVDMGCAFLMIKKSFLARYKLLNRYNFKFLILPAKQPYPRKVGQCKIIQERKKGRRTFAKVTMLETGEIKEKVLLVAKKRKGDDPIYSIYEICRVYYIV